MNGIPALLNKIAAITNPIALLTGDLGIIGNYFAAKQWGILLGSDRVINPDSIVALEYKQDYNVPNYPQEQGAFQSYNKVKLPQEQRVRMTKGGSLADRSAFLSAIKSAAASLNLYTILTPETSYENANITHYDLKRTATEGVGLITVDVWFTEIRNTAVAISFAPSVATVPAATDPVQAGIKQVENIASPSNHAAFNAKSAAAHPLFKPLP